MPAVTMLFTDVEGSTRLARTLGAEWPAVLAAHHELLAAGIAAHGGRVERTAGDSFFALFGGPEAALDAATSVQRALAAHAWPGALKVRMGVHTGVVERSAAELTGLDIHLAARVEGAAHGGQVVVTDATRAAVGGRFELASLGEHRLKDFPAPERLWQLVHDGRRPGDFPPLRTEPVRPTNLPADPRRLVGREAELESLWDRLTGDERLVTILGLGGIGKTRLAVAAGEGLLSAFAGGVWLVALAGVRDPASLIPAVVAALGVADADEAAVVQRLRARPTLLVLDNFEQLVEGAPAVSALLAQAPTTRVLVTSQLPLRVADERLLRLAPLRPDAAVTLFDERARAAAPGFDLREHDDTVAAICERLDGMPLAVELAAARVAAIEPAELLARLDRALGVLVRGPRDLPERHRTLRAALEWTQELLTRDERTLLARLAAFAGPAPLDAVEAIAAVEGSHGPVDALEALSGLIDASFVVRADSREHGVRYTVPQAARDFAAERLAASGEEHAVRAAHAVHLAVLAEACHGLGDPDPVRARVLALEAEQRVALDWARAHAPDLHTRAAVALGITQIDTCRAREAHAELGLVLARVGITGAAGGLAAVERAYAAQAIGAADDGASLIASGLAALRSAGDDALLEFGLRMAAIHRWFAGDPERALGHAEEAVALARRREHVGDLAVDLLYLAARLIDVGRLDEAERVIDEAAPLVPVVGDSTLTVSGSAGDLAFARGDWAVAARVWAESALTLGHLVNALAMTVGGVAIALARLGADEAALELEACSSRIMEDIGEIADDPVTAKHGWVLDAARERVGTERAVAAERRGRALPQAESAARAAALVELAGAPRSAQGRAPVEPM